MARPKNENNTYTLACKVMGDRIVPVKTNPKQFRALAERYGVTDAELKDSYVSRAGRKELAAMKLTVDEAVAKFGLHPNVAAKLKAVVKPTPEPVAVVAPVTEDSVITLEPSPEVPAVAVETPAVEETVVVEETVAEPVVAA